MSAAGAPNGSYNELKSKWSVFRNAFRLELVLAGHSEDYLFIPIKTPQGGGNRRGSHRQAETVKDLSNCLRRMKCCDDPHAAATTIAFENVECEHSAHQFGPRIIGKSREASGGDNLIGQ